MCFCSAWNKNVANKKTPPKFCWKRMPNGEMCLVECSGQTSTRFIKQK